MGELTRVKVVDAQGSTWSLSIADEEAVLEQRAPGCGEQQVRFPAELLRAVTERLGGGRAYEDIDDLASDLPEWEGYPEGTEWAVRCRLGWLDHGNGWGPERDARTWTERADAKAALAVARARTGWSGPVTLCRRALDPEAEERCSECSSRKADSASTCGECGRAEGCGECGECGCLGNGHRWVGGWTPG